MSNNFGARAWVSQQQAALQQYTTNSNNETKTSTAPRVTAYADMSNEQLADALRALEKTIYDVKAIMRVRRMLTDECQCEHICHGCDGAAALNDD